MALLLNLALVNVPAEAQINCVYVPFEGPEQLRDLRDACRATHAVRRRGDKIAVVPMKKEAPNVAGEVAAVRPSEDATLLATLVKDALLEHVHGLGRTVRRASPLLFMSSRRDDDLFADLAQEERRADSFVTRYGLSSPTSS